ncbi:glucosyl-dolichyl phosphate glucuronosyltransferase [Haloterrigena salina]|uniref:glucosyl-dolichyl phosphate glucuronosyltransferase n=1 Tax=Haloterrigena salina TaxID=504937 RepID=UPI00067817FA|nr:glucosyl-dolichyl phosphate glucuronosyltransferase [Haloterrigena salina]
MDVSVVLSTYDMDAYDDFDDAATSVLEQTYDDVELVIVVDGTEAVYERARDDYGDRDDIVVHCNEENRGLLASRNRGAELANGDETWIESLVEAYESEHAIAAGGKMTPRWVAGRPDFLPDEFYWLVGVTHRGFADGEGEVRNTFGSNISFRRDVFLELGGFDPDIGGQKGDKNLQGGETELCARMQRKYGRGVWYVPDAEVEHKVFEYRTKPTWLFERAFWQGYSKRAMETLVPDSSDEESEYLGRLLLEFAPDRARSLAADPDLGRASRFLALFTFTAAVGFGYLYGLVRYR